MTNASYAPRAQLESHAHRLPSLTLVWRGRFVEKQGERVLVGRPGDVLYTPAEATHSNVIGSEGAEASIVELSLPDCGHLLDPDLLPTEVRALPQALASRLTFEVRRELSEQDPVTHLALDGLLCHLLAELIRDAGRRVDSGAPAWLQHAIEFLHDRRGATPRTSEIAREVGVHPSHLARTFRLHLGSSPGSYHRRLRVQQAALALAESDVPLSQVALEAGFWDQAHFCRTFKRHTGRTPGEYRRRHQG